MSEQQPEPSHQDPAEQYQTTTETQTSDQPDEPAGDTTEGGELNHTEESAPVEPVEAQPVEVAPSAAPVKTDKVFDQEYEVTPERGYRAVREG
jgi:hypothetical protein